MQIRFVPRPGAVAELLKGPQVAADLERRAQNVQRSAGPGHKIETEIGAHRARAAVITDTIEAMQSEATNRTLTRAIDAARG